MNDARPVISMVGVPSISVALICNVVVTPSEIV
jgi:hypothetical protein